MTTPTPSGAFDAEPEVRTPRFDDRYDGGWISPEGDFHACCFEGHYALAGELFRFHALPSKTQNGWADEEMLEHGWARVETSMDHKHAEPDRTVYVYGRLTTRQLITIKKLGLGKDHVIDGREL